MPLPTSSTTSSRCPSEVSILLIALPFRIVGSPSVFAFALAWKHTLCSYERGGGRGSARRAAPGCIRTYRVGGCAWVSSHALERALREGGRASQNGGAVARGGGAYAALSL